MKPVIEVNNIGKSYTISHQEKASYDTIKDDFAKLIKKPFGGGSESKQETFWALKDINFEVKQGESFGIIGKNGSGKSTLLKILSRIVDPATGSIKIHGKVASLLEVGTGFHPELTGRENIYFNGSMIGMSKREIAKKFDEIVAFSEVEKFLDTPVKFYSSGMFVRLAFSVAAHLDSDILILDEVLSVGDAGFQKKSLEKMSSVAGEGRTIIFVSHSMKSVEDLCDRAMLLHEGRIKLIDRADKVSDAYLRENAPKIINLGAKNQSKRLDVNYGKEINIEKLLCAEPTNRFFYGENLSFTAIIKSKIDIDKQITFGVGINDLSGNRLFTYETNDFKISPKQRLEVDISISSPRLYPSTYTLDIGARIGNKTLDFMGQALVFKVDEGGSKRPSRLMQELETLGYISPDVELIVKK